MYNLIHYKCVLYTVEPGHNDISFYVTSFIASNTLWYRLIRHC